MAFAIREDARSRARSKWSAVVEYSECCPDSSPQCSKTQRELCACRRASRKEGGRSGDDALKKAAADEVQTRCRYRPRAADALCTWSAPTAGGCDVHRQYTAGASDIVRRSARTPTTRRSTDSAVVKEGRAALDVGAAARKERRLEDPRLVVAGGAEDADLADDGLDGEDDELAAVVRPSDDLDAVALGEAQPAGDDEADGLAVAHRASVPDEDDGLGKVVVRALDVARLQDRPVLKEPMERLAGPVRRSGLAAQAAEALAGRQDELAEARDDEAAGVAGVELGEESRMRVKVGEGTLLRDVLRVADAALALRLELVLQARVSTPTVRAPSGPRTCT